MSGRLLLWCFVSDALVGIVHRFHVETRVWWLEDSRIEAKDATP